MLLMMQFWHGQQQQHGMDNIHIFDKF